MEKKASSSKSDASSRSSVKSGEDEKSTEELLVEAQNRVDTLIHDLAAMKQEGKTELEMKTKKKKLIVALAKTSFWTNQRDFIYAANNNNPHPNPQFVRLMAFLPYIYAIQIKQIHYKNNRTKWFCVKVGFTHTTNNSHRPLAVQKAVMKKFLEAGFVIALEDIEVFFCVPISSIDPNLTIEVEAKLRLKVGISIPAGDAKDVHKLPVHTEWVYTSEGHINRLKIICEKESVDTSDFPDEPFAGPLPTNLKAADFVNDCPKVPIASSDDTTTMTKKVKRMTVEG